MISPIGNRRLKKGEIARRLVEQPAHPNAQHFTFFETQNSILRTLDTPHARV